MLLSFINKANLSKTEYKNSQEAEKDKLDKIVNWMDEFNSNEKLTADLFSFSPFNSNWNVKNVGEALNFLYNN